MERPPWTPTDHELALRVSDGQEWAFEELLRRHRDLLHLHTQVINGAPGESLEDFLQAGMLGLLKAARTYSAARGAGFRSFASLAIRAEIITALKTARRGKHGPLNDSHRLEAAATDDDDGLTLGEVLAAPERDEPAATVIRQEELRELVTAARRCSALERRALVRVLNGNSYAGDKRIDNALQRARRKLAA